VSIPNVSSPQISIIIVNYKVPEHLIETLRSIRQAELYDHTEIIIVDNASGDGSQKIITEEFPNVTWIQLKHNIGFGKACNVGVHSARSSYVLLLNPDTVIAHNTLLVAYNFMESRPDVGLMGPKILNPDGTLQASCKRGFPTPSAAIYHFTGLSRLFPHSKRFGRYNLSFINADQSSEVDAVSGSFMFIRRSLYLQIDGFDERFFLYGEDLDLCHRIRETGHKIWYHPETQIIHRKGKSSAKNLFRSRIAFYEAMVLFSRKYRKTNQGFFPGWLLFVGILFLSAINIGINLIRHFFAVIIDLTIINTVLWIVITLRFPPDGNPYFTLGFWYMLGIHSLLSASFLMLFGYNGIYTKRRYSIANVLLSGLLATALFSATIYFVKQFALSRIAFATSSVIISFLLVGWRELTPLALDRFRRLTFSPDKIILVGNGPITDVIIRNIEKQRIGKITGIVWNNNDRSPGEYAGYPVLGHLDELKSILVRYTVDTLIIATREPWYSHIIDVMSNLSIKNITIRWVPHDLTALPADQLPDDIPLRDLSV
jgi:O-antigen biosynthesis protein